RHVPPAHPAQRRRAAGRPRPALPARQGARPAPGPAPADPHRPRRRHRARARHPRPLPPPGPAPAVERRGRERRARGARRPPPRGLFPQWSGEDASAVAGALAATRTDALQDRLLEELSGGQRQRVWIAMALAQQTEVLLLDEPTTYLDVTHQLEVLDVVRDLNRHRGTTIGIVLHDLNLAARYADHLVAVRDGEIYAEGAPAAVITERMVHEVFALNARVVPDPVTGTPMVLP